MADFNQISHLNRAGAGLGAPPRAKRGVSGQGSAAPLPLFAVVAVLAVYGLVVVFSAVQGNDKYSFANQLMGMAGGIALMLMFYAVDYRKLAGYTSLLLAINVLLILSPHLPVVGVTAMGATSWLKIGPLPQIQPGEFAKVTVILLDASVMASFGGTINDVRSYIKALVYIAVPFLCIMTQPDLGTGLVYLVIGAFSLVIGGARPKHILITIGLLAAMVAALVALDEVIKNARGAEDYLFLKQYQRNRLLVFMDPTADTSASGYNLAQAMTAIGSGGLFGKGYGNASQATLGFLPEAPSDFIFCVLAEQFGFVGALALLALYVALILICCGIARSSSDLFGTLIVMGVVGMWLFHIMENIGMDIGLMPITGIPLPFMSYGSSFMVVNFALVGLVASVHAHK